MVAEGGEENDRLEQADPLEEALETARRFRHGDFFSLIAFLERAAHAEVRIGEDGPVMEEPLRFRHDSSMGFSPADVSALDLVEEKDDRGHRNRPFAVATTFLGLTGSVTPLPTYFATEVSQDAGDEAVLEDFLDVFHHRILSLFYRSVVRYNYPIEFTSDLADSWSKRLLALAGIDTYETETDPPLPRWRLLRLAPLLVRQGSSLWSLETALEDVLENELEGAEVSIEQFVGSWVAVLEDQQIHLGDTNCVLGRDTVIGRQAYDRTGKFRIVIGPMNYTTYSRFQQDPAVKRMIAATVNLFCRDPLDYDLGLVLAGDAVPGLRLATDSATRLGVDTFLGQQGESEIIMEMPRTSNAA